MINQIIPIIKMSTFKNQKSDISSPKERNDSGGFREYGLEGPEFPTILNNENNLIEQDNKNPEKLFLERGKNKNELQKKFISLNHENDSKKKTTLLEENLIEKNFDSNSEPKNFQENITSRKEYILPENQSGINIQYLYNKNMNKDQHIHESKDNISPSEYVNSDNFFKTRKHNMVYEENTPNDITKKVKLERTIHCGCFRNRCHNGRCVFVENGLKCVDCQCKLCQNNDEYFNKKKALSILKSSSKNMKGEMPLPWVIQDKEKHTQIKQKKLKCRTKGCLCKNKKCSGKQCSCLKKNIPCTESCYFRICLNRKN